MAIASPTSCGSGQTHLVARLARDPQRARSPPLDVVEAELRHVAGPQPESAPRAGELCGILGDEAIEQRGFAGTSMTSMPFSNLTPAMTFGN